MISHKDRLAGGLLGLLVGDALGVPYEFHDPDELPARTLLEFDPPLGFRRPHASVLPSTWSDDGAQALALLGSLLTLGKFELQDFSSRLLAWYDHGEMAVDSRVFDIGIQTSHALERLRNGVSPEHSGPSEERSNGNGSLMRVLPLALWHTGTDTELCRDAALQSLVTHGHARSQACCAIYCLWARRTLDGSNTAWSDAVSAFRTVYPTDHALRVEFETYLEPDQDPVGHGTGYVVDCLNSARAVIDDGSYEDVVKSTIKLGHDTDTTACVAGGIAGIRDGIEAIPER